MGFPIRTSADRGLVDGSPQLFAVTHVLHRFLAPRHPPLALRSLERTKFMFVKEQDARACSAVLKVRFVARHRSTERRLELDGERRRPGVPGGTRGCTEASRFRLLQNGREDKCVVLHEEVRPKPTNLLELGDEPTSAPTGCPDIGWSCDHRRYGMDSLERR